MCSPWIFPVINPRRSLLKLKSLWGDIFTVHKRPNDKVRSTPFEMRERLYFCMAIRRRGNYEECVFALYTVMRRPVDEQVIALSFSDKPATNPLLQGDIFEWHERKPRPCTLIWGADDSRHPPYYATAHPVQFIHTTSWQGSVFTKLLWSLSEWELRFGPLQQKRTPLPNQRIRHQPNLYEQRFNVHD